MSCDCRFGAEVLSTLAFFRFLETYDNEYLNVSDSSADEAVDMLRSFKKRFFFYLDWLFFGILKCYTVIINHDMTIMKRSSRVIT